ncbi:uncharacterized protein PAC_14956 [Phialocephala subalpina]|uniref:C2H2-type domain-containing protein n=1 Tax=Phialocephala subalpina TaxID=576137 RepID=A0A1L7XJE0_9HELO|nr:uncharacterized protein PAC_14956 [Phialocephala subalpina]
MNVPDDCYVNPMELDLRNYRWPLEETSLGNRCKRTGDQMPSGMYAKRRRIIRQGTPISGTSSPPHLSQLSSICNCLDVLKTTEQRSGVAFQAGQERHRLFSREVGSRCQENLRKELNRKNGIKVAQTSLITPPQSVKCSSRGSNISDTHSEGSTVQYVTSPRSSSDNEFWDSENGDSVLNNEYQPSPRLSGWTHSLIPCAYLTAHSSIPSKMLTSKYLDPQTIELPPDSLHMDKGCWNGPASPDVSPISTHEISSSPSWLTFHGPSYAQIDGRTDNSQIASCNSFSLARREGICSDAQTGPLSFPMSNDLIPAITGTDSVPVVCEAAEDLTNPRVSNPIENDFKSGEETQDRHNIESPLELSQSTTTQLMPHDQDSRVEQTNAQSSVDMFLKKGSLGTIEDWSLEIPDNFDDEPLDSQSPSTTILMATAEEELGERISRVLHNDPGLAQILLSKLKDKLSFILPLLCDEEDQSPFDFSQRYYYNGQERGPSGQTSSSGASSSAKSSAGTSIMTPSTSVDLREQEDDEVPQRSRKRVKISSSRGRGVQGRRRLRCHFHAKCPITHTQKTCVLSGWLSIHNLRGHYLDKHTRIRCNKCFTEFESKPPKNQHQRNCNVNRPPPVLDVIDCDKTDEIEDDFGNFRTWRLDREEDAVMRAWILKYKKEFVSNNLPADDDHDCRELAKWYHLWRILFPSHQGAVPSPFQNASISPSDVKVERLLEVFQDTVHAKVSNDQLPPIDLGPQIDYYKDIIRTVLRLFIREPDSGVESNADISARSDGSLITDPANSSMDGRQGAVPPSQHAGLLSSSNNVSASVGQRERSSVVQNAALSGFNTTQAPSAPVSMASPCAVETRGAGGETPMVMVRRSISFQGISQMSPHQMGNSESMMPPPMARTNSTTFDPRHQSVDQLQRQQKQQGQMQRFNPSMARATPHFAPNSSPRNSFFPQQQQDQREDNWSDLQVHFRPFHCADCFDSGFSMGSGEPQQCHCGARASHHGKPSSRAHPTATRSQSLIPSGIIHVYSSTLRAVLASPRHDFYLGALSLTSVLASVFEDVDLDSIRACFAYCVDVPVAFWWGGVGDFACGTGLVDGVRLLGDKEFHRLF